MVYKIRVEGGEIWSYNLSINLKKRAANLFIQKNMDMPLAFLFYRRQRQKFVSFKK